MAMTRTLYDLADPADVVFVHSARAPRDIVFRHELDLIAATAPNIRVVHICEDDRPYEPWGGYRGRLTIETLRQVAPDFLEREVFTCGPTPYMAAVRRMLSEAGLDMDHYHQESFTFEALETSTASADTGDGTAAGFKVQFARSGRTIECDADTALLAAASRAGLSLPASCAQGMCGTCKTTLVSGSVDMRHSGGIRPREITQNKILLCCSKPLEDLVIDS
jgi:ferredoxin-NADP reductase